MPDLKKDDPPNTKCCSCGHKWYFFHPLFFHFHDSFFSGRDKDGIHKNEFNKEGNHKVTGTKYDLDGNDQHGFDKKGIHKVTGTKWNEWGVARSGETNWDKHGVGPRDEYTDAITIDDLTGNPLNTFDENGIHKGTGTRYDENGYDQEGYDERGFNKDGYDKDGKPAPVVGESFKKFSENPIIRDTSFEQISFHPSGIREVTGTKYDLDGYDENGFNKDGFDKDGCVQFELTSKFTTIISSFNSEFDAFVTLAYNEPTTVLSKSFFSHDKKTGIYSKEFESFSNNNVVHFHIEKVFAQPPKYPTKSDGDLVSGYTLIVNFNKNDSELKSILIKKLGKMIFGCSPSEYTLDCHLYEKYPTDERAKELLQKVVELFNSENDAES